MPGTFFCVTDIKNIVVLVLPMMATLVLLALLLSQADKGFSQPSIQSVCKRTSVLGSIVYGKNKLFFDLIMSKAIFQDHLDNMNYGFISDGGSITYNIYKNISGSLLHFCLDLTKALERA